MSTGSPSQAGDEATHRTRRAGWPTAATVIGAGFVLWGLLIGLGRMADNSLFTHIATGRLIMAGNFPRSDPYSFTAAGEPWVVQSWLASAIYGFLDQWIGPNGIRLFMGLMTATLAALTWQLTRPAKTLLGRVVVTALVLAIGSSVWAPRPLLLGLAFLAVVLLAAEGRFPAPVLLPVMWIWANAHGSFPLALVALAALALGRKLDGGDPRTELRALAWVAGGTALAVVGPLGPSVLAFPVRLLQRQEVLQQVIEWQSPSFDSVWARLFLLQVALAILLLVRRPSYRAAVPLVLFTAAALLGVRNVAVASLVLVPGMARGLVNVGTVRGRETGLVPKVALSVLVAAGLVVTAVQLRQPAYDLSTYPVDAVAWMDQQGLREGEVRAMTQETVGNYLELLDGEEATVFLDDRVDMYPAEVVDDFVAVLRGHPRWAEVLTERDIGVVLWERNQPLTSLLSADPAWHIAYTDPGWIVACRRDLSAC